MEKLQLGEIKGSIFLSVFHLTERERSSYLSNATGSWIANFHLREVEGLDTGRKDNVLLLDNKDG